MQNNEHCESLETRLRRVEAEKSGTYDPRTEHLAADGATLFINRLILEDSPYLLQHAHNPVNWYAWGAEAFATAEREHKPVFLSIGYSTCHWCHVMEVESFDNVEVAKLLNEHFISIKMDREQFPDIDEVYMTGVQIMSGQGGWPMSNFLLADGKPFFGATYFPAAAFMQILNQVVAAWNGKYEELEKSASQISAAIDRILSERKPATPLDPQLSENMLQSLLRREDRSFGGLAGAPKFPQEPLLLLMLDRVRRNRELETLAFIERALEGMACGGIYDQVAGGFHRYSVDAQWLVPHFEKMLYNQSQLGLVYLRAWQLTRNPFFQRVCEQTLNYVLRDMQLPEGGFYSATDADSEGEEGTFFTWTELELTQALLQGEFALVQKVFDISADGNFEGSNILSLKNGLGQLAKQSGSDNFCNELDGILHKLYEVRERRVHPLRDDKLIVAWTGAMITTLARAAFEFDNADWLTAAERAAQLVWAQNVDATQLPINLQRIYLNAAVSINGQLEDYANLMEALIVLFDITSNSRYLQQAWQLLTAIFAAFRDEESGSFYLSPAQQVGPQLTRSCSAADGATLSAVATALRSMIALRQRAQLLGSEPSLQIETLTTNINRTMAAMSNAVNENPLSHPSVLRALASAQRGSIENIQYAANGLARLAVRHVSVAADKLSVHCNLQLQPGWHVTAPQAEAGEYAPLELSVAEAESSWVLQGVEFPPANASLSDPTGTSVPVYEGSIDITACFGRSAASADALSNSIGISVQVQLCNDQNCLLPEALQFRC